MAQILLTNVINKKLSIDELFEWLTSDNIEDPVLPVISQTGCTRTDFVSYFLNYLREECKRVLPEDKEIQEKSGKKATPGETIKPGILRVRKSEEFSIKSDLTNRHETVQRDDQYARQSNTQPRIENAVFYSSSPLQGPQVMCMGPRLPSGGSNASSPMQMANFPPLPHQTFGSPSANYLNCQHPMGNIPPNFHPNYQFQQAQFPGNFNHGNVQKYPMQQMSPRQYFDNPAQGSRLSCPTSPHRSFNSSVLGYDQAHMQMANLSVSATSGTLDSSFADASFNASSPVRFDNSIRNGANNPNLSNTPFSPVSPLYANYTSVLCPRSVGRSQNESRNSPDSPSNANISRGSTPKSLIGSGQKGGKSSQNASLCLGDFMTNEGQGSKKKSKKQLKVLASRPSPAEQRTSESKTDANKNSSLAKAMINEVKSPRRIKPTRLNVSNDKESRGSEVFGVISRPTIANPKFVEAPSTDKDQKELKFEIERGLLKLERQRQPKSETTVEAVNPESNQMGSSKAEATIVPTFDLVENKEALEILASLYGGILNHNLMSNPMSELYFLVTLITTQYKVKLGKKAGKIKEEGESPSIKSLEPEDDLGCSELSDDASTGAKEDEDSTNDEKKLDELSKETNESLIVDDSTVESSLSDDSSFHYLDSPHNCVYFAILVILKQNYFLNVLDRATLKLFCENQQIASFRALVQQSFDHVYSAKCSTINRIKQIDSGGSQTNVCFQVDTDNRETFPSGVAFTLFRKQRDLFYDILKDWEDSHLKPDWSFQRALKSKINALFALHTDAVNYCHFAKLFVSQLLISSMQNGKTDDPMNDESLSFLKSLKHSNPEKLQQLKERLVTPLVSTGPVPQPTFPGVQEFYKEFILNAANWKFHVILENRLIYEIMELNDTQFTRSDIEGSEMTVDESTQQHFVTCVCSLKLLAKFTSFTISLPFKSVASSPEWIYSQIQLRERVLPPLDLQNCLLDALTNGRLSLTVPWIVQYMAMLDTASLRLAYYTKVGEMLYWIYRLSSFFNSLEKNEEKEVSMSRQTSMLMMFTIGWLFELENFPRDLYTDWQVNFDRNKYLIATRTKNPQGLSNRKLADEKNCKGFGTPRSTLDQLNIIDDRTFYECCPFLSQLRILLISGNATLSNNNANRHITPVSSQLSQSNFCVKTKNLQMQLEEAFFHGQPSSIRKTVDFVSERIASSCVKYICNAIIPASKERNIKEYIKSFNGEIDHISKDEDFEERIETSPGVTPPKSQKKLVDAEIKVLVTVIKEDVKRESLQTIPEMCTKKATKSMESLLPDDISPTVKETCAAIVKRMSIDRIEQWIDSHIVESLFLKNVHVELKNLLKKGSREEARENQHNAQVSPPTEVIDMMRSSMWELLEKKNRWAKLSVNFIDRMLTKLHQTLTERADLVEYPERTLFSMSIELCLLLITHRNNLFTTNIQKKFMNVWKINPSRSEDNRHLFERILCPRNIRLITSASSTSSMKVFSRLLKGLLEEGILTIDSLSDQCVALFRQEWPEPVLKDLSQCLKDVTAELKCTEANAERIKYLIGWIADTCDEMEIYD